MPFIAAHCSTSSASSYYSCKSVPAINFKHGLLLPLLPLPLHLPACGFRETGFIAKINLIFTSSETAHRIIQLLLTYSSFFSFSSPLLLGTGRKQGPREWSKRKKRHFTGPLQMGLEIPRSGLKLISRANLKLWTIGMDVGPHFNNWNKSADVQRRNFVPRTIILLGKQLNL